jgi:hypothetical protein
MTGIIVKGSFPTNTIKGYVTKYYGEYDMHDAQWKPMFEVKSSDRAFELEALTDNLTIIPAKPESTNITFQSGQERFNTTYNHTSFGGGFQISREAKSDGKELDLVQKYTRQLGDAAKRTNEINGANIMNRGFDATYKGGDNVELYTTLHPVNSGFQANTLTNQAALSEATLEDLCILVNKTKDYNGNFTAIKTDVLCIPPALEFEAERILNSVARVATANNDLNALRATSKFPKGFCVNQYLDSDNRYFIKTSAPEGMKMFDRESPEFSMDSAFDAEVSKYKIFFRNSFGWTDFRGTVASGNF